MQTTPETRHGTDDSLTIAAPEFIWTESEHTQAHGYLVPPALRMLCEFGARTVLDLGCGNGSVTGLLAAQGFLVAGCDITSSGLSLARSRHPGIEFFEHEMSRPIPPGHLGRYDAVISLEVIEHLLLPRTLVANALQALRPGGLLVLSTPYHGFWKNLVLALTNKFDDHWQPLRDFGHVKFFSKRTLIRLLRESGFCVQQVHTAGRIPLFACSILVAATAPEHEVPAHGLPL